MRKTLGAVAVLATVLTGCGGEDTAGDAAKPTAGGGTLTDITGDQLCATVDSATIERQFGQSVENALGGRNEYQERDSTSCSYVTESLMSSDGMDEIEDALTVDTNVRTAAEKASTAEQALAAYMLDDDGETIAYTPVDGLGMAAGYAGSDLDVRQGGAHLVTIVKDDGKFIEVTAKAEPDATLDQLKPIATELVEGVRTALG